MTKKLKIFKVNVPFTGFDIRKSSEKIPVSHHPLTTKYVWIHSWSIFPFQSDMTSLKLKFRHQSVCGLRTGDSDPLIPVPKKTYESPIDQLLFSRAWQALAIRGYLPAVKDFKKFKVNFQRHAVRNVDPIYTVHAIWIVAWVSGTFKFVVLHITTS